MRLFVAAPLPAEAAQDAARLLREAHALGWPVRWVKEDGLHVSLKFFGEVTTNRVEAIEEMIEFAIQGMHPMELTPLGGGAFPSRQHPKVLRLEVQSGPELELLQDRLERGGERIGFPPEGRPFRPHVTLGRVREGQRLPAGAMQQLESLQVGGPFLADRIVLYESRLTTDGPAYTARLEKVLLP